MFPKLKPVPSKGIQKTGGKVAGFEVSSQMKADRLGIVMNTIFMSAAGAQIYSQFEKNLTNLIVKSAGKNAGQLKKSQLLQIFARVCSLDSDRKARLEALTKTPLTTSKNNSELGKKYKNLVKELDSKTIRKDVERITKELNFT